MDEQDFNKFDQLWMLGKVVDSNLISIHLSNFLLLNAVLNITYPMPCWVVVLSY